MPRRPRLVVPGLPHHVTQGGARRGRTFDAETDYADYLALLQGCCARHGVSIWSYCLMPNHVHLIAVPETCAALSLAIGRAHKIYADRINLREACTGHLWQDRYFSCVMDESHTLMAARYIERNPVAAGLVRQPADWRWSSARRHLDGTADPLVAAAPLLNMVPNWQAFLAEPPAATSETRLHRHLRAGLPFGADAFISGLEVRFGRPLRLPRRERPARRPDG